MIPGDIDLTKNLDFRRTRKKELPQFPASWKNNNGNVGINSSIYTTLYYPNDDITFNNNVLTYTTLQDDIYITNNTQTYSVRIHDIDSYWSTDVDYFTVSSNLSSTITSTTSNTIKYIVSKVEPERDIFGNIIEPEKLMEQICWQKDELSNIHRQKPIKQIPWTDNNHRNFNLTRHHIYDDCIPWDTEYIRSKKKESIVDRICYLAGKSARFISDYFNEDKEDLSLYLTNMNWIGVHDAIIE